MSVPAFLASARFGGYQPPVLLFEGRRKTLPISAQAQQEIDAKTARLRDALDALQRWDTQAHRTPVIKRMDVGAIVQSGQAFLQRQAENPPYVPLPYIIGISGGTASGKTTLRDQWFSIFEQHPNNQSDLLIEKVELDMFYRDHADRRQKLGEEKFFVDTNLDSPRAMVMSEVHRFIHDIKEGRAWRNPDYNFHTSLRKDGANLKVPTPFMLVEGLFALHTRPLRDASELKVFVDVDADTQSQRWWERSKTRNPETPHKTLQKFFDRGMAMQEKYILPQKTHANLVLNGTAPLYQSSEVLRRLSDILVETFYPPSPRSDIRV